MRIYFTYWKAILLLMILKICFTFLKKCSGTMVGRTQVLKSWIQYSNQSQSQCDTNNNNPCWNTKIGVFLIWNHIFSWYMFLWSRDYSWFFGHNIFSWANFKCTVTPLSPLVIFRINRSGTPRFIWTRIIERMSTEDSALNLAYMAHVRQNHSTYLH